MFIVCVLERCQVWDLQVTLHACNNCAPLGHGFSCHQAHSTGHPTQILEEFCHG